MKGDRLRIGDRVRLRTYFNNEPDSTKADSRDQAFGPLAKHAIGTVWEMSGNTVGVLWDDPTMIDAMYRDADTSWSPNWFDVVGHLDFSTPDKIETFLNGRAT